MTRSRPARIWRAATAAPSADAVQGRCQGEHRKQHQDAAYPCQAFHRVVSQDCSSPSTRSLTRLLSTSICVSRASSSSCSSSIERNDYRRFAHVLAAQPAVVLFAQVVADCMLQFRAAYAVEGRPPSAVAALPWAKLSSVKPFAALATPQERGTR